MSSIIGEKSTFAIESHISRAFVSLHFKSIGFFVIHIGGYRYGKYKNDATMVNVSYDEVKHRFNMRGRHLSRLVGESASEFANFFREVNYTDCSPAREAFGLSIEGFTKEIYNGRLLWAPDGDEAFDDGSFIFQFDHGDRVRLIGFQSIDETEGNHYSPSSLRDIWIPAELFYDILCRWLKAFEEEWQATPKERSRADEPEP